MKKEIGKFLLDLAKIIFAGGFLTLATDLTPTKLIGLAVFGIGFFVVMLIGFSLIKNKKK